MPLLLKFIELNWQGIIALLALGISIWQGWQIRIHNKLSVRPHLTTWINTDAKKGYYTLELINNGIGPALIEEFLVKVDGKIISGQGSEPLEKALKIILPSDLKYTTLHGYISKGYSMTAKEKIIIVAIQFPKQSFPSLEFMNEAIKRTTLDIDYKSFYKEPFHFHFPA